MDFAHYINCFAIGNRAWLSIILLLDMLQLHRFITKIGVGMMFEKAHLPI
jgi:hypothetical protein